MPITPTVFRPIRTDDVYQKPFKAYKSYRIAHPGIGAAYVTQSGVHGNFRLDIGDDFTSGYLTENSDGTNVHVIWKSLNHRFYTDGGSNLPEHGLNHRTERFLFYSASTIALPYNDVGARLKPGTLQISQSRNPLGVHIELKDDANGNLRDPIVSTSSFASSSREIFHMTFNNEFRRFRNIEGTTDSGSVKYKFRNAITSRAEINNLDFKKGVVTTGSFDRHSGMAVKFRNRHSFIRVPHDSLYNRFNQCDDWSIAFWIKNSVEGTEGFTERPIITKGGLFKKERINTKKSRTSDKVTRKLEQYDRNYDMPPIKGNYNQKRTPFMIGVETLHLTASFNRAMYHFQASDGTKALHISASHRYTTAPSASTSWTHVIVQNSSSVCQMFINGRRTGSKGTLPAEVTTNAADVLIGNFHAGGWSSIPADVSTPLFVNSPVIFEGDLTIHPGGKITILPNGSLTVYGNLLNQGEIDILNADGHEGAGLLDVKGYIDDESLLNVETNAIVRIGNEQPFNDYSLAEIRMYDYALNNTAITSLSNRDYLTGSLYQTNVAGNIFYRNGQLVTSSPMPKYQSGSGMFGDATGNSYYINWKGTHTIYENQVFVRVPSDVANVSVNPSATYLPTTTGQKLCDTSQANRPPGEYRKAMFVSGTAVPYVTTIGLYNDEAQLVAVAKMAQPIQKRNDVDTNFIVRWDY